MERTVPLGIEDIDFSSVAQPATEDMVDWEAPPHVYFGKKLPNGKKDKEPVYVHQEYPRMLYGRVDGKVRTQVVTNEDSCQTALADGWVKNPAELGIITQPSFDDARRMKEAKATVEMQTETVEIVKRKPGRPKAA